MRAALDSLELRVLRSVEASKLERLKCQATKVERFLWYQPLSRQVSDACGICGSWAEVEDGGEDALVVFYANILAMTNSRLEMGVHSGDIYDVISCDV